MRDKNDLRATVVVVVNGNPAGVFRQGMLAEITQTVLRIPHGSPFP